MENRKLIKKLENIPLPEIEIQSHKTGLRFSLLNSDYFKGPDFIEVLKRPLLFAVPSLAVLIIIVTIAVQPQLAQAKAIKIVKNNSEIQKLMEENNLVLDDIKIKDGKAYLLFNPPLTEKTHNIKIIRQETEDENKAEKMEGAIVELNIKKKEVTKINPIRGDDISPLNDKEKESAKEIAESEEVVESLLPKGAHIEKIQSSLPDKIQLLGEDHSFQVVSKDENDKKARIHYSLNGKEWVIQVNLDEKKVEEIEYPYNKSKGRD